MFLLALFNTYITLIVLIFSNQGPKDYKKTSSFHMVPEDTLSLKVDKYTPNITTCIEYLNNNESIAILTKEREQKILVYSFRTKKLLHKIPLTGLPPGVMGFLYINNDSIYLHYYSTQKVYLVDKAMSIKKIVKITNDTMDVKTWTPSRMIYFNRKLYLAGSILGEYNWEKRKRRPVISDIDYRMGTISYLLDYPDVYKTANWGGAMFRMIYFCFNPHTQSIIISFPAYEKLLKYNIKSEKINYVNGLSEVHKELIEPLSKSKQIPTGIDRESKHFVENNSYAHIFYDRWQNVYYRILEVKEKYYGGKFSKSISIIILDSDFNYKGETLIRTKNYLHPLWRYSAFVTPKGLNLQIPSDEDHFSFLTYSLKKQ